MSLVSIEKLEAIKNLTPEQIRDNGAVLLADLSGWLKHEQALLDIPLRTDKSPTDLGEPTYPNPEEEIDDLELRRQFEQEGDTWHPPTVRSETFSSVSATTTEPPKKKRGRPPGSKNKPKQG